ncbi:MAG: hypothetical protein OIF54_16255 [Cohaesibacter sp.]|nr:hypothetical protein [Cohaesibacter sp.]
MRHTSRVLPIALLRARETVMGPIRDMLNENGLTEQGQRLLISNMPTSNQIYARIEADYGREKLEKLLDLLEDLQELKI